MRVLLNSIKWSFNWKAPLHFPIIWSKLKADAHSLMRILILFPENQKSLSPCQDILQTQVHFRAFSFSAPHLWRMDCLPSVNWRRFNGSGNNCSPYYVRSGPMSGFSFWFMPSICKCIVCCYLYLFMNTICFSVTSGLKVMQLYRSLCHFCIRLSWRLELEEPFHQCKLNYL